MFKKILLLTIYCVLFNSLFGQNSVVLTVVNLKELATTYLNSETVFVTDQERWIFCSFSIFDLQLIMGLFFPGKLVVSGSVALINQKGQILVGGVPLVMVSTMICRQSMLQQNTARKIEQFCNSHQEFFALLHNGLLGLKRYRRMIYFKGNSRSRHHLKCSNTSWHGS